VTHWLELNTGWRRNDANTLARDAGSEPPTAEFFCQTSIEVVAINTVNK
jgi:hypothetical protein